MEHALKPVISGVPAILSFSQQEPDTARKIYYTIKFSTIIIFEGIISSILFNLKVLKKFANSAYWFVHWKAGSVVGF